MKNVININNIIDKELITKKNDDFTSLYSNLVSKSLIKNKNICPKNENDIIGKAFFNTIIGQTMFSLDFFNLDDTNKNKNKIERIAIRNIIHIIK